jgi:hypothetical protein
MVQESLELSYVQETSPLFARSNAFSIFSCASVSLTVLDEADALLEAAAEEHPAILMQMTADKDTAIVFFNIDFLSWASNALSLQNRKETLKYA